MGMLGHLSAALWLISSLAWWWAASTKAPLVKAEWGRLQDYDDLSSYQTTITFRNAVAAGLSGVAAVLASAAVLFGG